MVRRTDYMTARRNRRWRGGNAALVALVALGAGVWWNFLRGDAVEQEISASAERQPMLTTDRPESPSPPPQTAVSEKGDTPPPPAPIESVDADAKRVETLLSTGKEALARGELIAARSYLSEAYLRGLDAPQTALLRAELTRIGQETIFSGRVLPDDPLAESYIVKPGDTLGKIAKQHRISDDLVAEINGLTDKNSIRIGQTLKLVHGPFHAMVHKQSFVMDVFLDRVLVKHFKVGLGAEGSTPTGEWRVGTKLVNPTYYPPRGGQVIAADDPQNPLGERWIGLVGVSGAAVGQERYGIHGTIEPQSIGQNVSLGCVRMYNEDVAQLYSYFVEKYSTVTIVGD